MSIEKLNELIQSAPEFNQWWSKNHTQIQAALKRKRRIGLSVFGVVFAALQASMVWALWNLPSIPLSTQCFGTAIFMVAGSLFVTLGTDLIRKWSHQWPKDSPQPLETLINPDDLLDGSGKEVLACDPLIQKDLLEKIVHHPNSDVRLHAQSLLTLKDLALPRLWWRALEIVLEDIECIEQESCIALSPEQQRDSVYFEIEKSIPVSSNSKVFRL